MKLIVVTNPRSRANRREPGLASDLAARLGSAGAVVTPPSLEALDELAPHLGKAEMLCIHGGDGTLHRVLTAMHHASVPVPPVVLLRAGTMNIVANSIGSRLPAKEMLDHVIAGRPSRVETRHLMEVNLGEQVVVGFLAGGGIISRFLEMYYDNDDPTPSDAAWLLARGAASALVGGSLARRLTRPYEGELELDGRVWAGRRWLAVAVGTVEQLGLGFRPFPKVKSSPGKMQVIGIGSGIGALARELPSVFRGRGVHRPGNIEGLAEKLVMRSEEPIVCMVDGDFHAGGHEVELRVGAAVSFVVAT